MKEKPFQLGQLITEEVGSKNGLKIRLSEDYWYSNSIEVYAVPKPQLIHATGFLEYGEEIDIVVSPFKPKTWKNIYSLKFRPFVKKDETGFIAKFTKILKDAKISILSLQSNPTFSEQPFSFWLLVDLSQYDILKKIDEKIESVNINDPDDPHSYSLRGSLLKIELQDLLASFIEVTEVRGVQFLYNFVRDLETKANQHWSDISENKGIKFAIANYRGMIPKEVISNILGIKRQSVQYSIVSNPNQKSYFITRIFSTSHLIYMDVRNKDQVGSIHSISKCISEHGGNILTATALIESIDGDFCHYFLLITSKIDKSSEMLVKLSQLSLVSNIIVYNYSQNLQKEIYSRAVRRTNNIKVHRQHEPFKSFQKFRDRFSEQDSISMRKVFLDYIVDILKKAIHLFVLFIIFMVNIYIFRFNVKNLFDKIQVMIENIGGE